MFKQLHFGLVLLLPLACFPVLSQIVEIVPARATGEDEVTVIFDATQGTQGLVGEDTVYMHSGLVTDGPDGLSWQYVIGNWGEDDGVGRMTPVDSADDKWQITLTPGIREYHQAPEGTNVFRLAMVFRNEDGSKKGAGTPGSFTGGFVADNGDIYVDLVVNEYITILSPVDNEIFISQGDTIMIMAEASNTADSMALFIDQGQGFSASPDHFVTGSSLIEYPFVPDSSMSLRLKISGIINNDTTGVQSSHQVYIRTGVNVAALPDSWRQGINYLDSNSAGLVLLAPGKEFVYVVGDFNNWKVQDNYLMNRDPDNEHFWIELDSLIPGKEYVFQYWVEGQIKIGDPFADKVADPWNDQYIPSTVYPDLIQYDQTSYGIATVLQTDQVSYNWAVTEDTWERPAKENLVIYELLVRDFLGSHDYKDLIDTLSYLKGLGVNAIELMPVMEFEGNESWGYNPSYFFAPDKYYGTKNDLKKFIETAHQMGFAVILDMVLNHAFGQNPMVMMYWDNGNNRPSADNPWFNQQATHPFNVGFDFNHESKYTQAFVDSVNTYWLQEYHFDGFRFDLSKGFTQNVTNDVGVWSQYDQSRIDLLIRMDSMISTYDSTAYVILEHFAVPEEENVLMSEGMLVWHNRNYDYKNVLAGNTGYSFTGIDHEQKVTYMESHDEDRMMYYSLVSGQNEGIYNIRDTLVALERMKMGAAFFLTAPGPVMLWQFQELGYDVDINFNGRTGNKPVPWGVDGLGYYEDSVRQNVYKVISNILKLRNNYLYVINEGTFVQDASGDTRRIMITHDSLDINIIGNFSTGSRTIDPAFPSTGSWFDYLTGDTLEVSDPNAQIELAPGEFHLFTSEKVHTPPEGLVTVFKPVVVTDPVKFSSVETVTLTFDAEAADPGNTNGLEGADKVYFHSGAVTSGPDGTEWSYVTGNLGQDDGIGLMEKVAGEASKWQITFTPRDYYEVPDGNSIFRIGMFFRDAADNDRGYGFGGREIYINLEPDPDQRVVVTEPDTFLATMNVRIIFNAAVADPAGTPGLVGASKVYMHAGVITDSPSGTSWQHVVGNWGQDDGVGEMTKVSGTDNKWEITLVPRDYFSVPSGETVYRIGMVFRNADGSGEGKAEGGQDIFIDVAQSITGLADEEEFNLHVYPVPADRYLIIRTTGRFSKEYDFRLIDALGKNYTPTAINHSYNERLLDVSNLPGGVYVIRITTGKTRISRKILIQK